MGNSIRIDDNNFDDAVIKAKTPVLVDFWTPWCGPCKAVAPVLEELAEDYNGKMVIAEINVDENPQNASKYGVSAFPTMLIFNNGAPVHSIIGYKSKSALKKAIDEVL